METPPYRGRFAPSPTGPLHFGSLLAALGSWLLARHAGGAWWVRIEDLDPPRERNGAAQAQLAALHAFGLHPDAPPVWQSTRSGAYEAALARLMAQGDAFTCHCSRSSVDDAGGIHRACSPGAHRADPAIRLRVPAGTIVRFEDAFQGHVEQDVGREVGDFVLRRADGPWAYQLAVVVDDAAQGITDVVRGADLLDSTPRQILLQRALGLQTPTYAHLPVLVDDDGRKLSKSSDALPVDPGHPLPALTSAWHALGQVRLQPAAMASPGDWLASALASFDPARIPRARHLPLAALHNAPVTRPV